MTSAEGRETSELSTSEIKEEANRAIAFLGASRFQDAVISSDRILEREPDNVDALVVAGYAALGLEDWTGAARHLEKAAELEPSEEAELGWARALAAEGRIEQAVWRLDRAASLNEDSAEALLRAGDLLLNLAREVGGDDARRPWALEEAKKRLIAATAIEGAPPVAWLRLGRLTRSRKPSPGLSRLSRRPFSMTRIFWRLVSGSPKWPTTESDTRGREGRSSQSCGRST